MRWRPSALLGAIAVAWVTLDQVTKALVRERLGPGTPAIPVVGNLVRLVYTRNAGAAFGLLPGNRAVFVTVSILVLVGVFAYVWRYRPTHMWVVVAVGLLAGGALGNLIDRVWLGMVTDFIQIPLDFPIFNVADSGIVVGVAMLVWWLLFGPAPEPVTVDPSADAEASEPSADDVPGGSGA